LEVFVIRLDKFLAQMNMGTRSEVKNAIRKGKVLLNGEICKNADIKIDENLDVVCYENYEVIYEKFVYYMLNKPAGVVSATKDNLDKTVMDLLCDVKKQDVFPVGRLDKDTEGLLLLTNDGELAHKLLAPKNHIPKTYFVRTKEEVTKEQLELLENGVDIGEDTLTMPALTEKICDNEILLTIYEGKFHQVKRMLKAVNNEVVYLKRQKMGDLLLDESLKKGEYRKLTADEIGLLKMYNRG
jgi:16S rRNA pseudouridine516 synthase